MNPMLNPFQMLLMQARGFAPQPGMPQEPGQPPGPQPQPQQPSQPQQAPQQPAPKSRLDRLLSRYDQFATGQMDPSLLNPQQRSLMRRQLMMQIGGSLQANGSIAGGVGAHQQTVAQMQERQQMEARQRALREAMSGGAAPMGGMPMKTAAGVPAGASPNGAQGAGGGGAREQMVAAYQRLLQGGFFEEADKLSEQINRLFPQEEFGEGQVVMRNGVPTLVRYGKFGNEEVLDGMDPAVKGTLATLSDRAMLLDPYTGQPMATYQTGMTPYQREKLALEQQKLAQGAGGAGAPGGLAGPTTHWDPTTKILYRLEGDKWKPDATFGRRYDAAQASVGRAQRQAAELTRYANDALELAANPALPRVTGVMGYLLDAPNGAAQAARTQLEEVKSRFSLTALAQMRQNSPTGGAVGNVTEKEWSRLESAAQLIRTADSPQQVQKALRSWADAVAQYNSAMEQAVNREAAPLLAVDNNGEAPAISLPKPNVAPQPGAVVDGYRFRGGNPADPANWEPAR